jgi:hypothetical protein
MGATLEALIAAFCRLDKSLSCPFREKGWLVGAVGTEPIAHGLTIAKASVEASEDPSNWVQLGSNNSRMPYKIVIQQIRRAKEKQRDSTFGFDF